MIVLVISRLTAVRVVLRRATMGWAFALRVLDPPSNAWQH
jgi:hypothetical protein